ncbi:MAG TPA: hypothetical protein PK668_08615 [Myxococcota bacterium]|nr:hypothetical protein [Myxococcota bacterium]HRY92960.1 hypothetical protein [Myxococcota bacterium]HSA22557.1 hypothetical protein [Myxococcota bacterium]
MSSQPGAPPDLEALRRAGRPRLAALLEGLWGVPLLEHSLRLHAHRPALPLEPELEEAFFLELLRLGTDPDVLEAALADLRARRVLMTATHLTASEGPTFLAVHRAASLGLPAGVPYLVGAYANVPFSSAAWSGCLSHSDRHNLSELLEPASETFRALSRDEAQRALDTRAGHERRVSLVRGSQRDARVYRAGVAQKLREVRAALRPPLAGLLPPVTGESFTAWALAASQAVLARVLPGVSPVYLDLTEVAAAYLQRVLPRAAHPVARLLFDPAVRARALGALGDLALFGADEARRKGERWAPVNEQGGRLVGAGLELPLAPGPVVEALRAGRLAPGLLLTFAPLCALSGFRCLGSFEQVEYLPRVKAALEVAGCFPADALAAMDCDALATGRCVDRAGKPVWPLDLVLGTRWSFPEETTVGAWLAPLWPRLTS